MSPAEVEVQVETEHERIERWRAEELEKAGYDVWAAAQLAASPEVDLHLAVELVERGCAPDLALKILL
jgi:hypothetical protein